MKAVFPEPKHSLPHDPLGAFCRDNHIAVAGARSGPLVRFTFAAKDVFDVAGARTGFGQPAWLKSHLPADSNAWAVQRLLDHGATLVGKTLSDELCYSLTGENIHYGTPLNPWAPDRVPGGSSNGSASAVAGGLVDFAIGTDCGGSVRVPASYCGVLGIRPTHGRVPLDGAAPFAPSFDCVGWFARDPDLLLLVGRTLLCDAREPSPLSTLLIAADGFAQLDRDVRAALVLGVKRLAERVGTTRETTLSPEGLEDWFETFRVLQAAEVWNSLGPWIKKWRPVLGPGVRERFQAASAITPERVAQAQSKRHEIVERLNTLLEPGKVLCLPTTPRPAPLLNSDTADVEVAYRHRAMALLCSAGLAGLPQLSLPLARLGSLPLGLSIIARRGADLDLMHLAAQVCDVVPAAPLPVR